MNTPTIWRQTMPLCLCLAALWAAPAALANPPATAPRPVLTVQVATPTSTTLERTVHANGSLAA